MKYDFDKVTERKNTMSLKYDFAQKMGKPEDVLPLWVADMDFPAAPEIIEELKKTAEFGIFGYSEAKEDYFEAVAGWYKRHFNWDVKEEWLVKTPGVMFGVSCAVRGLTEKGDSVLIQRPVYHPFSSVILDNGRNLVNNPLRLSGGRYEIDFQDFEEKIIKNRVKMFLLCSPHNPAGRVWEEWELRKMADICLSHNVIIVSDEIHGDFVYEGKKHLVLAGLDERYGNITITCTAPSKTFNLAGLQVSNIWIAHEEMRRKVKWAGNCTGYEELSLMGLTACKAAYTYGEPWLAELKKYLKGNLDYTRSFLQDRLPDIRLIEPEGTYLLWLDFRGLGLEPDALEELIVKKAGLWFNRGAIFGEEGEGFERMNIACPRKILKTALEKLEDAVKQR